MPSSITPGFENATFNKSNGNASLTNSKKGGWPRFGSSVARKKRRDAGVKKIEKQTKTEKVDRFGPLDLHKIVRARFTKAPKSQRTASSVTLRDSLVPGAVCIILLGPHEGKRVVLLKQLERSQQLLVTGPKSINGVPLQRIDHRFVIGSSTKVDISSLKLPEIDDSILDKPERPSRNAKPEDKQAYEKSLKDREEKISSVQDSIDGPLTRLIQSTELLSDYLADTFTLRDGEYPHLMKF